MVSAAFGMLLKWKELITGILRLAILSTGFCDLRNRFSTQKMQLWDSIFLFGSRQAPPFAGEFTTEKYTNKDYHNNHNRKRKETEPGHMYEDFRSLRRDYLHGNFRNSWTVRLLNKDDLDFGSVILSHKFTAKKKSFSLTQRWMPRMKWTVMDGNRLKVCAIKWSTWPWLTLCHRQTWVTAY